MAGRDTKKLKFPVYFMVQLIFLMFSRASVSAYSTTVKLHEAATLQCYKSCSGLVTWFHKPHDILASCDQTSCQSQEGFQMLHDEYLKGNLSLIITDADFTKRMMYTCQCNDKDICDVSLHLEPPNHSVDVQAGDSVSLDLLISEDVAVTFKKSDNDTKKLCKVKVQFESSYENRVSVSSSLQLKDVKNSDGGVYIIHDINNDEVIGTYTVTINGPRTWQDKHIGVAAVCGMVMGIAVSCLVMLIVKTQLLQKCLRWRRNEQNNLSQVQEEIKNQVQNTVKDLT